MSERLLETVGLRKNFGGVAAIDGVDFTLGRGELRCLIGPNGAGKSTFCKMLTGQLRATAGHVLLNGTDVTHAEAHEIARRGVGIKNQVPDVFDNLSVRENLWMAARSCQKVRQSGARADETLERLHLRTLADSLVGELAHGQRQWVELGMLMAREPHLILLDEPAAGMTAHETERTAELILEANRTATIVVVEHDMQFIRKIARRVTVFHQGRILVEGTMAEVEEDHRVRDVYLGRAGHA